MNNYTQIVMVISLEATYYVIHCMSDSSNIFSSTIAKNVEKQCKNVLATELLKNKCMWWFSTENYY